MYSGPSGQATTISTNDPNRMARPSVDRTRPSHVAPSDTSAALLHGRRAGRRRRCRRPRSARRSWRPACVPVVRRRPVRRRVVGRGRGRAEHLEAERSRRAPSSPFGCSVVQLTLHVAGRHRHEDRHGERLAVGALDRRRRRSAAPNGLLRHVIVTVESPTGASKLEDDLRRRCVELGAVLGDVLSRFGRLRAAGPPPTRSAPRPPPPARRRGTAAGGREHRFGWAPPEQGSGQPVP